MGGILHLFDFNQVSTSRKLLTHKRHVDGLEAPRNSLELPVETSQCNHGTYDNLPYSYKVKEHPKKNFYPSGTPVKKLIDEMYKETETRPNVPSVVARLMGMDMLPPDIKPMIYETEGKNKNARNNIPRKELADSILNNPLISKPLKQTKQDVLPHQNKRDPDQFRNRSKSVKPREHPQEEQLQKFKKEFEAWQASKVWEHSKSIQLDSIPRQWKDTQTLAQENLNKEKMALYAYSKRKFANEKPIDPKDCFSPSTLNTTMTHQSGGLQHYGYKNKLLQPSQKEAMTVQNRTKGRDFEQFPQSNCEDKCDRSSLPTKIVILKPSPEMGDAAEGSCGGSSEIVEEEGSIEDFLEEVKERLRFEIQGNSRNDIGVTGSRNETPFNERETDPKEIARNIAKQVRESVARDLGITLLRSESTRSYRSEVQLNRPGSPEFIDRGTRKFLSERLTNILRSEKSTVTPTLINGSSITSMLDKEEARLKPATDVSGTGKKVSYWESMKEVPETKARSFRHGLSIDEAFHAGEEVSPRNLVRSFSAPVSGTSFGKLLSEDQHVLTGAHVRRKHEATENVSVELRKTRKDRLSFRGKVSNLRYSFTLRGKLFGKKIQSVEESRMNDANKLKIIMNEPSVLMNFGVAKENSTEVPPSPASVCSSAHEDFCRPGDQPSPDSILDVPFDEDHSMPQVFREINCSLHELRRQLNQLEYDGSEAMPIEEEPLEAETANLEGENEAYIKDVLIAAGFYNRSSDQELWRWEPLTKPIDDMVYVEVEEAHKKSGKEDERTIKDHSDSKVDHRVLFDLLNEALSIIQGPPLIRSVFKRGILGPTIVPCGKKLLEEVWQMIHMHVYAPMDGCHSLDDMVSHDLGKTPWLGIMYDDIELTGREVEEMVLDDLIEEIVGDLC